MKEGHSGLITGVVIAVIILTGGYFLFAKPSSNSTLPITGTNDNSQSNCISSQEAYNEIGKNTCVEYTVGSTTVSRSGNVFLDENANYTSGFSVTIFYENVSKFSDPATEYANKTIDVTGFIQEYQGHPEIIASDPSQITEK